MSVIRIACPGCAAVLRTGTASVGKQIRCPKCGEAFAVSAETEDPLAADADQLDGAAPPDNPTCSPRQHSSAGLLAYTLIALFCLSIIGGTVALWAHAFTREPGGQVDNTPPRPEPGGGQPPRGAPNPMGGNPAPPRPVIPLARGLLSSATLNLAVPALPPNVGPMPPLPPGMRPPGFARPGRPNSPTGSP